MANKNSFVQGVKIDGAKIVSILNNRLNPNGYEVVVKAKTPELLSAVTNVVSTKLSEYLRNGNTIEPYTEEADEVVSNYWHTAQLKLNPLNE